MFLPMEAYKMVALCIQHGSIQLCWEHTHTVAMDEMMRSVGIESVELSSEN